MRPRPRGAVLDTHQKKIATEIAARFDPKDDGPEMRREMRDAFKAAEIRPGQDLKTVLQEAGFETAPPPSRKGRGQGGPGPRRHGPRNLGPPPGLPGFVHSFIDKRSGGNVSQADTQQFMAQFRQMGDPPKGIFVNLAA